MMMTCPRTHGLLQASDVRIAVGRIRQEVEGGAVLPQFVGIPGSDVHDDPVDPVAASAEPLFCRFEGLCGEIEDRQPAESLVEQASTSREAPPTTSRMPASVEMPVAAIISSDRVGFS